MKNALACTYEPLTTCRAEGLWGNNLYGTRLDVTALATWTSDAQNVVDVLKVDNVTLVAVGPGKAHVNATYDGVTGIGNFVVCPGDPVVHQFWPGAVDQFGAPIPLPC